MTPQTPPRFVEWMLMRCLAERDRDTISGDLLEEYREEQLPRSGFLRANLWYLRQAMGLCARTPAGPLMKAALAWMSVFTAACGLWLTYMEQMLRHAGYAERTAIWASIVAEGVATLLLLALGGRGIFRILVTLAGGGAALFGAWAVTVILTAPPFEGYLLVTSVALAIQGLLTLAVAPRGSRGV